MQARTLYNVNLKVQKNCFFHDILEKKIRKKETEYFSKIAEFNILLKIWLLHF